MKFLNFSVIVFLNKAIGVTSDMSSDGQTSLGSYIIIGLPVTLF